MGTKISSCGAHHDDAWMLVKLSAPGGPGLGMEVAMKQLSAPGLSKEVALKQLSAPGLARRADSLGPGDKSVPARP